MEGSDSDQQSNPCAICLSGMGPGGGQAIFTAECSHTFHFQCISASVAHGNHVCPLCNAQWHQLPFLRPAQPSPAMPPTLPQQAPQRRPMHRVQPPFQFQPPQPEVFDDDDEPASVQQQSQRQAAEAAAPGGIGTLVVRTHTEYSAIARDASHESFAALARTGGWRREELAFVWQLTPDGTGRGAAPWLSSLLTSSVPPSPAAAVLVLP